MKGVVVVVTSFDKLVKFKLPNGKNVDFLDNIGLVLKNNIQYDGMNESGGVLIGYTHRSLGSVVIEEITEPQINDKKGLLSFFRISNHHVEAVNKTKKRNSGYMGNWHTHPFDYPEPSNTDLASWQDSLIKEKTSCNYIFFVIVGRKGYRVWVGDIKNRILSEVVYL